MLTCSTLLKARTHPPGSGCTSQRLEPVKTSPISSSVLQIEIVFEFPERFIIDLSGTVEP